MMRMVTLLPCFLLAVLWQPTAALADDNNGEAGRVIAGWVEKIVLLDYDNKPIKAKLDSGAKTSSLHATDIEFFERDEEDWVRFTFEDKDGGKKRLERPEVRAVKIKDLGGGFDRRPVVELDFCFDGRVRSAQFTLADRSGFNYRVLLGRRFLSDVAVIDPSATYLTRQACEQGNAQ